MRTQFLIASFLFAPMAFAATSNQIANFNYVSCSETSCVVLKAPKAYVGLDLENFVTSGETILQVTDAKGKVASTFNGESASFNPKLQLIVLDTKNEGFLIYSLKDGALSDFRTKGALK